MADNDRFDDVEGTDEPEYIYVTAGDRLADGQVGIAEVDDAHPWVPPANPMGPGQRQAFIVKGDPTNHGGYVGMSSRVGEKLASGELQRAKAPKGTPEPIRDVPKGAAFERAVERVHGPRPAAQAPAQAGGEFAAAIEGAIARGIAAGIAQAQAQAPAPAPAVDEPPADSGGGSGNGGNGTTLTRMNRDDLVAYAQAQGVAHDPGATKAQIIEAIEAAGRQGGGE